MGYPCKGTTPLASQVVVVKIESETFIKTIELSAYLVVFKMPQCSVAVGVVQQESDGRVVRCIFEAHTLPKQTHHKHSRIRICAQSSRRSLLPTTPPPTGVPHSQENALP